MSRSVVIGLLVAAALLPGCRCSTSPAADGDIAIAGIDPAVAVVGERAEVEITGEGFIVPIQVNLDGSVAEVGEISVTLGAVALEDVVVHDPTRITAVVPDTLEVGTHGLTVVLSEDLSVSAVDIFEVVAPVTATLSMTPDIALGETTSLTLEVQSRSVSTATVAVEGDVTTAPAGILTVAGPLTLPAEVAAGETVSTATSVQETRGTPIAELVDLTLEVRWTMHGLSGLVPATTRVEVLTVSICTDASECINPCYSVYSCEAGRCSYGAADKDSDGDGYVDAACNGGDDCNDNPTDCGVDCNPGLAGADICDGTDNDCDGDVDEDPQASWYLDADGDGYGDPAAAQGGCAQPAGTVSNGTDCADTPGSDPNCGGLPGDQCHPGLAGSDICDGINNDCDADIDEDSDLTWYADVDGDGFGDPAAGQVVCAQPAGHVANSGDCAEIDGPDPSCNGLPGSSCHPGLAGMDVCDGANNDCDLSLDEDPDLAWYADADGDGYGNPGAMVSACTPPAGHVADGSDCADTNGPDPNCNGLNGASCHPGLAGADLCDGADNDCDTLIDEDGGTTWYADADGDGYGDAGATQDAWSQPAGYVADDTDCADVPLSDPNCGGLPGAQCNPGLAGSDICDGANNDCDGATDEDSNLTWYEDADADGYGNAAVSLVVCGQPAGHVADDTDCADAPVADPACGGLDGNQCNPGFDGSDGCDGANNDCDGLTDEDPDLLWYADDDNDTYGNPGAPQAACTAPGGYVADDTDCADTPVSDPACGNQDGSLCNPGLDGADVCDNANNDCDGLTDEDSDVTWYEDADGDGYGNVAVFQVVCVQPAGYVADATDCADVDGADPNCNDLHGSLCNPGRAGSDGCDLADNDCDTEVDEDSAISWYRDVDGDTHGDAGDTLTDCAQPVGYVPDNSDCDDTNSYCFAAGCVDADSDGVCVEQDCDDDPITGPTCDGVVTGVCATFCADTDSDTYGTIGTSASRCVAPVGFVSDCTDCNDGNPYCYTTPCLDADSDGVCVEEDCDDDAVTGPSCDGVVGGACSVFCPDGDSDTFGDNGSSVSRCVAPVGHVLDCSDCDDGNAYCYAAPCTDADGDSTCVEQDCDDDPVTGGGCDGVGVGACTSFCADTDIDTRGDAGATASRCVAPGGYVFDCSDCDDGNEWCYAAGCIDADADGVCAEADCDDDPATGPTCDGVVVGSCATFFADTDGDGFGNLASSTSRCAPPVGYVGNNSDCNDSNIYCYAAGCTDGDLDGICVEEDCDDDPVTGPTCDGVVSGACTTFCADTDSDTFGDGGTTASRCMAPGGFVSDCSDCDDGNTFCYVAGCTDADGDSICVEEDCDDDPVTGPTCDGVVTGACVTYCADTDGDTYGDSGASASRCVAPGGYVSDCSDCDDGNAYCYTAPCTDADVDGVCVEEDCDDAGPCGDLCAPTISETGGNCSDTWDNDCDGDIDGADSGCSACPPASTGWRNQTNNAADTGGDGDGFEVTPTEAYTDGVDEAGNINGMGDRHQFYDYGFGVPAGCDVQGITVRMDWRLESVNGANSMAVELSGDGGATWTAQNIDNQEGLPEHTVLFGGAYDNWGRTWISDELSDATFRVRVTSNSDANPRDFFLDWIPVDVNFGPTPVWQNTGWVSPTANSALQGGNNDGFEIQPDDAMTDGGGFAQDVNDGWATVAACDGDGHDLHGFYNFGFGLPAGSTIGEIEVRTDVWADAIDSDPFLCISLSWDGGASWTFPKVTPLLTPTEVSYVVGTGEGWGHNFVEGELTDANFQVRLRPTANTQWRDYSLDWVAVRLDYF